MQRQVAISGGLANSQFRARWQTHRPEWVSAFIAEFFGVFFFTLLGTMSTAVYIFGAVQEESLASVFQIGLAYALGVYSASRQFGIVPCAHTCPHTVALTVFLTCPAHPHPCRYYLRHRRRRYVQWWSLPPSHHTLPGRVQRFPPQEGTHVHLCPNPRWICSSTHHFRM